MDARKPREPCPRCRSSKVKRNGRYPSGAICWRCRSCGACWTFSGRLQGNRLQGARLEVATLAVASGLPVKEAARAGGVSAWWITSRREAARAELLRRGKLSGDGS